MLHAAVCQRNTLNQKKEEEKKEFGVFSEKEE